MPELTKQVVDAASTGIVWDAELSGFGLRTAPGGTKSYILSYRVGRGRHAPQRRITIGKHGSWTPETARREAMRLLGEVAKGGDPADAARQQHAP
jgi:Arm domain-containing DNA-binding protein